MERIASQAETVFFRGNDEINNHLNDFLYTDLFEKAYIEF